MNFKMMTDGQVVDGSWDLVVSVTDLQVEKTLRVRGDLHIGGVMLQLVEALGKYILLFFVFRKCTNRKAVKSFCTNSSVTRPLTMTAAGNCPWSWPALSQSLDRGLRQG